MATEAAKGEGGGVEERLAAQLEAIITKKISSDQLVLPSLPAVAAKCLALLKTPDLPLKDAAKVIETDPVLAAQVIKLSNSAAFGTREPIKGVMGAVTRLGAQKLKGFLVEFSARRLFESSDSRIASACQGLWHHSVAVALLARDVMLFSISGDAEMAYLSGLLHDVGKPVVGSMLLDAERSVMGTRHQAKWITGEEWIGVVQRCHRPIGIALAEKWQLPELVVQSIRDCEEYDNSDRQSVANVVRFANALAKQNGLCVGNVNQDDNDAMVMIGRSLLNVDETVVQRLTANLGQAIKEQTG